MGDLPNGRLALGRAACTILCCGLAGATIEAQSVNPPGARDAALLTITALTAVDDNGRGDQTVDVRDPQFQGVRPYSVVSAALLIDPQHDWFHWTVSASSAGRYYEGLHEFQAMSQSVAGSTSFTLGRRTTVAASGATTYSPTYSLVPFLAATANDPGQSLALLDYGVVNSANYSSSANLSISQALTSRLSFSAGYGMTAVRFTEANDPALTSSTAQARFTYRLTKYASVHAGYRRRLGQYDFSSNVQDARIDDYDLGVDYNRVLSLRASRNTTLSFTTGSSIYKDFDGRHYAVTGSANLDHRVGRNSRLGLVYARGVGFVEGLLAPVFTDSVTATAASALSRRVRFMSSVSYVVGNVNGGDVANSYGAWTGSGQFTVGLTRRLAVQTGYTYYQHNVGDAVQLFSHLPNHQRRQTVYAGLTFGLPLIRERVRSGR